MRSKLKLVYVKSKNRFNKLGRNKQRITIVLTTLVFVAIGQIIINSFAATVEYSPIPVVADMQKLTEEIVVLADDYAATPDKITTKKGANKTNALKVAKKSELISRVQARKDAYKKSIQYDPQTIANYYLPQATRDKLPAESKNNLEQFIETGGAWDRGIIEPKIDKSKSTEPTAPPVSNPVDFVFVQDKNGNDIYLYAKALPKIKSGSFVRIQGVIIDDIMAIVKPTNFAGAPVKSSNLLDPQKASALILPPNPVDFYDGINDAYDNIFDNLIFCADRVECAEDESPINLTNAAGASRKTLVIPVNFKEDPDSTFTFDNLENSFYQISNAYDSMSYGQFKPEYKVWQKWLTIDDSNIFDCSDLANVQNRLRKYTKSALGKDTVLISEIKNGYSDVMYVYNHNQCDNPDEVLQAQGWANISNSRAEGYIGESAILMTGLNIGSIDSLMGTMAHEMGHTYGLAHAHGACNDGAPIVEEYQFDYSKHCGSEFVEYADPYNLMGSGDFFEDSYSFNFANKLRMGWVDESADLKDISDEEGVYVINSLSNSNGVRALKLNYQGQDVFIEYRPKSSYGTDRFDKGIISSGLINYFTSSSGNTDAGTRLIGSNYVMVKGETKERPDIHMWSYAGAARLIPYKIGVGDDSICVTPSSSTQSSITIEIKRGCPEDAAPTSSEIVEYTGSMQTVEKKGDKDSVLIEAVGGGGGLSTDNLLYSSTAQRSKGSQLTCRISTDFAGNFTVFAGGAGEDATLNGPGAGGLGHGIGGNGGRGRVNHGGGGGGSSAVSLENSSSSLLIAGGGGGNGSYNLSPFVNGLGGSNSGGLNGQYWSASNWSNSGGSSGNRGRGGSSSTKAGEDGGERNGGGGLTGGTLRFSDNSGGGGGGGWGGGEGGGSESLYSKGGGGGGSGDSGPQESQENGCTNPRKSVRTDDKRNGYVKFTWGFSNFKQLEY